MKTWVCCWLLGVLIVVVMNVLRVEHIWVLNFGRDEPASRGGLHDIDEGEGASEFANIFK